MQEKALSGLLKQRQSLHQRIRDNEAQINQLEEQIRVTHKMASMGTMVGMVAHEFNNLLVPIINYAELALKDEDDRELTHKALTKTLEHGQRASSIVKSMLGMIRIQDQIHEAIDVQELVNETLQCITRDLSKDKIMVSQAIPDTLFVFGDPSQLLQVLFNIIINARQAMLQRGGTLKIEAKPRGTKTEITISDTGCGIPDDLIDKIFDPFVSTKTNETKSDLKGTGLGLAVCRDIIEAHHGSINVKSQLNQGTLFTITLPQNPNT